MFLNFFSDPVEEITPDETRIAINNENTVLLDVRTQQEYHDPNYGHITNSILIPLQTLFAKAHELDNFKDKDIIIYCRSGQRSAEACRILNRLGFKTKNMSGGILRWNKHGFENPLKTI